MLVELFEHFNLGIKTLIEFQEKNICEYGKEDYKELGVKTMFWRVYYNGKILIKRY